MKMKAAVLTNMGLPHPFAETRPVEIKEVELDPPGAGEVLVKVAAAGVCHSDLSVVEGVRPRPMPMVLGHEASGVVAGVGPGVEDFAEGDHVVFVFVPACGECTPCKEGRPALCEPGIAANSAGVMIDGGVRLSLDGQPAYHFAGVSCFAEYAVVSRNSLIKVDSELDLDEMALFSCAVITGVGAVINTGQVPLGSTVAVVGLGGVGLAAMLGAKAAGARLVVGLDIHDNKLEIGRQLGADACFDANDDDVVDKVKEATGGGCEYVIECVGKVEAMNLAYKITKRGGTTVTCGLSHPATSFEVQHVNLVTEERTIKGSYLGSCVPKRDIPRYISLFQRGQLPVDKLLSERIELEDINEAFDRLAKAETIRQIITF